MRFNAKMSECCRNFSVDVVLKLWFSHAQYMKMTRYEHILGFKSCDIPIYWQIWMLSFQLKQIWIGIYYFLLSLSVPRVPLFCRALQSYNSPGDWVRELFTPSTDSGSLVVKIEKKRFSIRVWAFLGGTSQVGVFLRYFGHLCLALGAIPMGHFLNSKCSWKLGQNLRL